MTTDQKLDKLTEQFEKLYSTFGRPAAEFQANGPTPNRPPAAVHKANPSFQADEEALYQRFKARLVAEGFGAGGSFTVTPPEKLRKDFQQAEATRIVESVKALPALPKLILKFIEAVPGFTGQATIAKRIDRSNNGEFGKAVKQLASLGFAESKDRVGVATAMRRTIAFDLEAYQPTEEEVEAVYQAALYEIATGE